jgi:serine protease Do
MNYAIPISELRDTVGDILANKFVRRTAKSDENPNRYSSLDFGIVMIPDVVYRTPAYIDSVLPGSAAAKAGLQPDDLVLFVNDELIQSNKTLGGELGRLEGGDTLKLIVRRGSKLISVKINVPKKNKTAAKR